MHCNIITVVLYHLIYYDILILYEMIYMEKDNNLDGFYQLIWCLKWMNQCIIMRSLVGIETLLFQCPKKISL